MADQLELELYPNPATNQVTISLNAPTGMASIEIIDMRGAVVDRSTMPLMGNVVLSTEKYEPGIYMVNLVTDGKLLDTVISSS